jgi:putative membrane-bound dehydrogenase-like protein
MTWLPTDRIQRLWPAVLLMAVACGCQSSGPPHSPEEALASFQLEPGFQIELFAAEPDIVDPVAMEIDENGRIYVIENPAYPLAVDGKLGRVKLLQDTDGDGRADSSTVFADGLTMPTGVMRWKKGILVTDAPDILYLEDSDGDDVADVRRVVLTGFAFSNPQHTVSSPTYGPDNWIYLAGENPVETNIFPDEFGDKGSDIRFPDRTGVAGLPQGGRSVRFRPDSYQLEILSSTSQFGHAFDDWGRYFTIGSGGNGYHEVIAARYLERNPDLLLSSTRQMLSSHTEVFPITERPEHQMLTGTGRITSACGLTFYRGGAFPASFGNLAFLAEPEHNLVLSNVISPSGATFQAQRLRKGKEFLASTDPWFRPVNFYVGPDGALYVLDYYRRVIEHAEWTAREVYESGAAYQGTEQGRIYRIVPDSGLPALPRDMRLGESTDEELVRHLENPNVWWRMTAQRLLVDRQSAGAVQPLIQLFQDSDSGAARVQALWTLEGLGKLDDGLVEKALEDPEPGVRENGVRLAESRLSDSPRLAEALVKLSDDPDPRLRFQLLCTLGPVESSPARAAREKLLERNIEDRWFQVAALSSASDGGPRMFRMAVSRLTGSRTDGRADFFRQVSSVVGARQRSAEIQQVIQTVARASGSEAGWWRLAALEGLAEGIERRGGELIKGEAAKNLLLKLSEGDDTSVRRASLSLLEVTGLPAGASAALARATAAAGNREADPDRRADAVGLLALADPAAHEPLLKSLVNPQEPEALQAAAVRAIGKIPGDGIGTYLVEQWRGMTSSVRNEAVDALLRDPGRTRMLVKAIENDQVQPWALQFGQRLGLLMNKDEQIRENSRKLLMQQPEERERVVDQYEEGLAMSGDAARGREVFDNACSKCHKFNGAGKEVGPDLGEVRNRPREVLLADILMPNQTISQGYEAYVVETANAGTVEGVMGPQTSTTITLRQEEGKEQVIRRQDITGFYAANLSAMPEDLEEQVDVQQMNDLLEYLKTAQ